MAPKQRDIGWEHGTLVGGSRKLVKCNYCRKQVHGGITRLKQHIAHVSGQVEGCLWVPKEVSQILKHLSESSKESSHKSKKKWAYEIFKWGRFLWCGRWKVKMKLKKLVV